MDLSPWRKYLYEPSAVETRDKGIIGAAAYSGHGIVCGSGMEKLTGRKAGIKWPNDVVYSGKKICGILTEMRIQEGKPEYIVIGVGINVNQTEFSPEQHAI